jgi:hypothetical protein
VTVFVYVTLTSLLLTEVPESKVAGFGNIVTEPLLVADIKSSKTDVPANYQVAPLVSETA